jgi:co-chaperonin GroES (HSP10)
MLFVPQGKEEYPNEGMVLGVGDKVVDVKVGDRVLFQRKPSSAVSPEARYGDEFYGLLVLPEDHILAIMEVTGD